MIIRIKHVLQACQGKDCSLELAQAAHVRTIGVLITLACCRSSSML